MGVVGILLLLQSCGGGDGSAGSGPMPAPGAPSAPAPPSPPAPPVSPSYDAASDFARNRSFTAIGLRVTVDRSSATQTVDARLDPESSAIGFDYLASTSTYQTRYDRDAITAVTMVASAAGPAYDRFEGPNSRFTRSPFSIGTGGPPTTSTYVGYVDWADNNGAGSNDPGTRSTQRYLLFGARTLGSDVPATGSATLTGQSTIAGGRGGGGDAGTITIDYAARTVTAATSYRPSALGNAGSSFHPPDPEPIAFAGTLDPATGRISGTATYSKTGAIGSFEGALYGPRGIEAAIAFKIPAADGTVTYGLLGTRN